MNWRNNSEVIKQIYVRDNERKVREPAALVHEIDHFVDINRTLNPLTRLPVDKIIFGYTDLFNTQLPDFLAKTIEENIEKRKIENEAKGRPFFDKDTLVRAVPAGVIIGREAMLVQHGRTTYFTYDGTKDLPWNETPWEYYGAASAVCGPLVAEHAGSDWVVVTERKKVAVYPEFVHMIGGMLETGKKGDIEMDPHLQFVKEIHEESGIPEDAIDVKYGLVPSMDLRYVHMEFPYVTRMEGLLDDHFNVDTSWGKDGMVLNPKNPTDKEVLLRAIPADKDALMRITVGDEAKPWVPTGLISGMQYLAGENLGDFDRMREEWKEFVRKLA